MTHGPIVVLHDHLDGGVRPATVLDLAHRHGVSTPTDDVDDLARWMTITPDIPVAEAFGRFDLVGKVLQTPEALRRVATAAVGDSANYYATESGALFVKGLAHRGQYGDGKLKTTDRFVQTASNVAAITAHTGHAILMTKSGDVLGTGGNIYGPVGRHGLGDKAVRWS